MSTSIIKAGASPEEAKAAVIFIHGRGSSGHDMSCFVRALQDDCVAWLAPSAPTGSWYPHRFLVPPEQNEPHLSEALQTVDHLVDSLGAAGLSPERIGIVGFSQGACLALEYAARNPRRYGFVAGLSGALIGTLDQERPAFSLGQTPVLLGCAEQDAHIPAEHVERTHRILQASNATVTRQRYPGDAHLIFPEEIQWIRNELTTIAADRPG